MTLEDFRKKIAEKQQGEVKKAETPAFDFSDADFAAVVNKQAPNHVEIVNTKAPEITGVQLEHDARKTVIALFSLPLDTEFTFNVRKGYAKQYINSMRQVVSRAKKQALAENVEVPHTKVLVMDIGEFPTHEQVRLIRSNSASLKQKKANAELISVMAAPVKKDASNVTSRTNVSGDAGHEIDKSEDDDEGAED